MLCRLRGLSILEVRGTGKARVKTAVTQGIDGGKGISMRKTLAVCRALCQAFLAPRLSPPTSQPPFPRILSLPPTTSLMSQR